MIFDPEKPDVELIRADARNLPLPDESVQCIVTSPPYWGLRKYSGEQESIWTNSLIECSHDWNATGKSGQRNRKGEPGGLHEGRKINNLEKTVLLNPETGSICVRCEAWRGAFGLEPTIDLYIQHTVTILRELRRVLRPDGVLFWNIGDSYHNGDKGGYRKGRLGPSSEIQRSNMAGDIPGAVNRNPQPGLKPKDLCLIPSRVAIAAQQDGWWIRSMILWVKPNPMPESCQDRPTDAYEHILMLTKSERYLWDAIAVAEPCVYPGDKRGERENNKYGRSASNTGSTRNIRNVWIFPPQPYSGAHFATFPEELPRRCILAATSPRGACAQCGAPWERITERHIEFESGSGKSGNPPSGKNGEEWEQAQSGECDIRMGPVIESETIGWRPTCLCPGQHGETVPCVVLDPFAGSGTTGRVARSLRRRAVLADIAYGENDEYRKLALERISEVDVELPFL